MPRLTTWQRFHSVCQRAMDHLVAYYEPRFRKRVSFLCPGCGDNFEVTIRWLSAQPGDIVQAPSRCAACRQGEER